jgi:ATP-dependent DNA ligase
LSSEAKQVRLFTRNGHDWTGCYPLIVQAALRNRSSSFVIDGEAVLLGIDGISDFKGLVTPAGTMTSFSSMPSIFWRWTAPQKSSACSRINPQRRHQA